MATITARRFEYGELRDRLQPDDRIVILSCDSCAKLSDGLGGEQGMTSLTDKLKADGHNVVHTELIPAACSADQLTDRLHDDSARKLFEEADVIIPLSCQAGEDRTNAVLPDLRILRVTRTLGKGSFTPETGARLTESREGVEIEISDDEGIPLAEAARRLGLYPGSF